MGLLNLLRKLRKSDTEAKLIILGLDNAGKTTLLKKISSENQYNTEPTLGFNVKTVLAESFKLNVWDIGGQKDIRKYWENYFENTDGIIFVVDSSDDFRITECNDELKMLLDEKKLKNVPVLIFANKNDIEGALDPDEIIEAMKLSNINDRQWMISSCSALKGDGIEDGMKWLVQKIKK